MPDVTLFSNGSYHVMVSADGNSRSQWHDLSLSRWREDAAVESGSAAYFIAAGHHPATRIALQSTMSAARPVAASRTVAVAVDQDVELDRIQLTNGSGVGHTIALTSYSEIVLSPAAVDASHPAFSKLFVETEIDESLGAILASRRPSSPEDARPWLFHTAVVHGQAPRLSYETDRLRFIGRGRSVADAEALCRTFPLSGHQGAVLDAIAAIRVPLSLEAGASCTIDWFTGIAPTREQARAMARRCGEAGAGDRMLASAPSYRAQTLRRIGASDADGAAFERLAAAVLCLDADLRADPAVLAKNDRGQSSLWGFGLSGDDPIVLVQAGGDDDLELVRQWVRAHAFWRAYGIRTELMVVGQASSPDGGQLLAAVTAAAKEGAGADQLDKRGGIFVRDGATFDDGDRILLQSVARIVATEPWPRLVERLQRRPAETAPTPVATRPESAAPAAAAPPPTGAAR